MLSPAQKEALRAMRRAMRLFGEALDDKGSTVWDL